jgi:putative tricarboxylic transport membrane protein
MTRVILKKIFPYLIVLAVAAIFYAATSQISFERTPGRIGPDAWPKAILALTIIVCVYEIVRTALFDRGHKEVEGLLEIIEEQTAEEKSEGIVEEDLPTYTHLLLAGIGLTVGYVLLFDVLGFFVDTLLYIVLFTLVGRYRRPGVVLASGLLGSLAFMFVFMKIVYVSLPIGHAPFSAVSLALMRLMGIR